MQEIKVEQNDVRVDLYLSEVLDISRSKVAKLKFKVNGKEVKNSYLVKENDVIIIEENIEDDYNVVPEKMDLDIVYEDDDVIVVNKANGMVVHPAAGNTHHTLVNGLMYYSKELSGINGSFRPGIVHRIDAYTTGLLLVAKNDKAHELLAEQLSNKTAKRKYIALVWGIINNDTGTIDAPIGRDLTDRKRMAVTATNSKEAVTHFKVIERYETTTLIELELETGRTHQIRVHMNYINYPIVNDPVYGKRKLIDDTGQCLHAKEIGFIHPTTKEYMQFACELPECFVKIVNHFKEE